MFDCYNAMCPFRVNYTSNPNRCECTACPRRCTELTFSYSDTTIIDHDTLTGSGEDMRTAKAPPIGIMPEHIWKRKRYSDLCCAIGRYVLAGMEPPPEWVEEGQRLLKEIEDSEVRFSFFEPIGVCNGDPVGPKGPPGVCPRCGGSDISWEADSDVSRCNTCGWSDGRGEHGIP